MNRSRLDERMDAIAAIMRDVPLDDAGNPISELPDCMDDDLAGEADSNPLGKLIHDLAAKMTHYAA